MATFKPLDGHLHNRKTKVSSEPFSVGTGARLATELGCLGPSM